MKLLLIRLEGALQSWGEWAKWDERDSGLMPTKSGVIGVLACCMGLKRGDPLGESIRPVVHFRGAEPDQREFRKDPLPGGKTRTNEREMIFQCWTF